MARSQASFANAAEFFNSLLELSTSPGAPHCGSQPYLTVPRGACAAILCSLSPYPTVSTSSCDDLAASFARPTATRQTELRQPQLKEQQLFLIWITTLSVRRSTIENNRGGQH